MYLCITIGLDTLLYLLFMFLTLKEHGAEYIVTLGLQKVWGRAKKCPT